MKKITPKRIGLVILALLMTAGMIMNIPSCSSTNSGSNDPTRAPITTQAVTTGGGEVVATDGTTEGSDSPVITDNTVEPKLIPVEENSIVSMVQSSKGDVHDLTYEDILAMVRQAIDYVGGIASVVKDGDTVILKPNLVTPIDYTLKGWNGKPLATEVNGNCTDWRVARAVAVIVREVNPSGKIIIMEGSAFPTPEVMAALNFTKEFIPEVDEFVAMENDSGDWRDPNSPNLARVKTPNALLYKEYFYNRRMFMADVVIDMPTLKNHWNAGVTGAIKNMSIGASPATMYGVGEDNNNRGIIPHDNLEFHKFLADFYACRPVNLVVMDALQGLDNGPTPCFDLTGITDITTCQKNMRTILCSKDGLAIDTVETNIINYDIDTVDYLNFLRAMKVGNGLIQNITVVGNIGIKDIRQDFAGSLPAYKVQRIPASEMTVPAVAITGFEADGANVKFSITPSGDVLRTEIYINGELKEIVKDNSKTSFNLPASSGTVSVKVYNRRMFEATATQAIG